MKWIAAGLICLYQRLISPWKGFRCAHGALHGGETCSEAVKQIILRKGLIPALQDIRDRFAECSRAASYLRNNPVQNPQKVLDCECGVFDSCPDPVSGCGDLFSGGGSASAEVGGCSGTDSKSGSPISIYFLPFGFVFALLIISFFGWSYTQQVSTVEIRLLENVSEESDQLIGKLTGNELPDYQILLSTKNKNVRTNILKDVSARNWLVFHPQDTIKKSDILTVSILEKDVLGEKTLDVIYLSKKQSKGESFEIEVKANWQIF